MLTRELVLAEGVPGRLLGRLLRSSSQLETLGVARRGYFVEGLGGAQFALPGAVERLRTHPGRDEPPIVLAAVDPAQPYGAALPGPPARTPTERPARRPARADGAYVVLVGGDPMLYLERGGRALQTLVDAERPARRAGAGRARGPRARGRDQARRAREGRRRAGAGLACSRRLLVAPASRKARAG